MNIKGFTILQKWTQNWLNKLVFSSRLQIEQRKHRHHLIAKQCKPNWSRNEVLKHPGTVGKSKTLHFNRPITDRKGQFIRWVGSAFDPPSIMFAFSATCASDRMRHVIDDTRASDPPYKFALTVQKYYNEPKNPENQSMNPNNQKRVQPFQSQGFA